MSLLDKKPVRQARKPIFNVSGGWVVSGGCVVCGGCVVSGGGVVVSSGAGQPTRTNALTKISDNAINISFFIVGFLLLYCF